VLVAHGTWNPPRDGERVWHQLDDANPENFCRQLNDRLDELGLGRAVWRPCKGEPTDFGWTGANRHQDRVFAAKQLAKRMVEIAARDPTARIHLVAHSHGGNVALAAVQLYLSYLQFQAQNVWHFNDTGRRPGHPLVEGLAAFFEGPADDLSPLYLPPVRDSAEAFGLGDEVRLRERWREAADEFRRDNGPGAVGTPSLSEFKSWWVQSPTHNRLGRLVFLGTPFYYKAWGGSDVWPPRLWFRMRRIAFLLDFAVWSALLMVLLYALIEAGWLVAALVTMPFGGALGWPTLDPLSWPIWLHVAWLPVFVLAGEEARLFSVPVAATNLYCEDTLVAALLLRYPVQMRPRPVMPLEALVIHAGHLDEVLLLMSCERIIRAALDDRVDSFLFARRERVVRPPMGTGVGLFAPQVKWLMLRIRGLVASLAQPLLWPMKKLLARYLRATVFKLLKTAAFGIDEADLRDARVDLFDRPRLKYTIRDHLWVVTGDLARGTPPSPASTAAARYAFLWSRDKFDEQLRKSQLLKQVERLFAQRDRGAGKSPPLDTATTYLALTLEERVREIVGLVDLAHSHYYSNKEVIARIARFIATGELPPGVA
jgi:hypothetical protein